MRKFNQNGHAGKLYMTDIPMPESYGIAGRHISSAEGRAMRIVEAPIFPAEDTAEETSLSADETAEEPSLSTEDTTIFRSATESLSYLNSSIFHVHIVDVMLFCVLRSKWMTNVNTGLV